MIRSAVVFVLLAAPACAAPAHRQPTPATVQPPGADPAPAASAATRGQPPQAEQARTKMQQDLDRRQKSMDARMKKTMGGVCSGC
jgi:hypothetical protein